ncbi:flagellar hook-associated protein FlgK [Enterococcus sp. PF-2]|jgi:flagellar hook-associated protein 1 FlgK|uniref:flagellar hook-associated protein FlgK n=1 Tax=Enterococcus TaxID=1350 RepID=UPI0011202B35|nr:MULTISPECIES: flagellar hook-associated protein FlgK [unclassified Enterococcus]TPE08480.1 flagellar hook-associated protein FlgK [Enterococcus sp. PF-3]TPE29571.1 flagellar hook-associated protein FlgK [Enterococcus sp. PF-2]
MTGLFGSLGTATRGMTANQAALQTSSHNIANTNTDGYSRQRVNLQAEASYHLAGVGSIGMGVKVGSVERIVDDFVIGQVRNANSTYTYYEQKADILGQLESLMNEPSDNGLSKQLATMFDSWTALANNPELDTSKTLVLENSSTFADTINQMGKQMTQLQSDTLDTIEKSALDFNEKVKQLQSLNEQIYGLTTSGETPNDLLDRRDSLLKDLSGLAGIETKTDQYGRGFVSMSGQTILSAEERNTLSVVVGQSDTGALVSKDGNALNPAETITGSYPAGTVLLTKTTDNGDTAYTELPIKEGAIGGLQASSSEIGSRLTELNNFTTTIAQAMNMVFTGGASRTSGLFEIGQDDTGTATTIRVSQALLDNPSLVTGGTSNAAGDGSRAAAMAKLSSAKLDFPLSEKTIASFDSETLTFANAASGMSVSSYFNSIVTKNGISKQQADNTVSAQLSLLNQIEYKNQSVSGVSLNEEMSDVIRFQQGFQANARILSVVSEMLDTLINRTGV